MHATIFTQEEAFELVKDKVYRVADQFWMRCRPRLRRDDARASSHYWFSQCWHKYHERGPEEFTRLIGRYIWGGLTNDLRQKILHDNGTKCDIIGREAIARKAYRQRQTTLEAMQEISDELSDDAQTVMMLVLDTPSDVAKVIVGKGGQPRNFRSTIRDYLRGLGWSTLRVKESYAEMKRVLQER